MPPVWITHIKPSKDTKNPFQNNEKTDIIKLLNLGLCFISLRLKSEQPMKKILVLLALTLNISAFAQSKILLSRTDSTQVMLKNFRKISSNVNLEFASSLNAYFTDNTFDECSFKMNRVRLEIFGRLHDRLSYHFRQSFNKYSNPYSVDNMSSSIEYANIKWHMNDRFEMVAGKQYLIIAGYEGYVNGLKVREFSDFNNHVEIYQTGLKGVISFTPTQKLMLQVTNNRNSRDSEVYLYGLPEGVESSKVPLIGTVNWNGWFADGAIHLMYSASAGQLAKGKNIYYLMCGNIYEKGPVLAYLDLLYSRSAIDSQQRITSLQGKLPGISPVTAQNTEYFTVIANLDYRIAPKWNAYIKGAYETAGVYKKNSIFESGRYTTSWNAQCCLEWFPFNEDKGFKLFAHYVYKGYVLTENAFAIGAQKMDTQRVSLGIQYIIPVL